MTLSKAQKRALRIAAEHPRGAIMAGVRVGGAAADAVIDALDRRGLIEWDGFAPRINQAGRDAVEAHGGDN